MSKFLFIHQNHEPKEEDLKVLDALGSVLFFRDTCLNQSSTDIFNKYDVVVLDVANSQYRQWYSSYRATILAPGTIKIVFLHHAHTHIDEKLVATLKNEWNINSIIKELPKVFLNKEDLISKLTRNIHLASLDLPEVESCFKTFFLAAGEKLGCISK
jgi:hypothetical protein